MVVFDRNPGNFRCYPHDLNIKDPVSGYVKSCYITDSDKRIPNIEIDNLDIRSSSMNINSE